MKDGSGRSTGLGGGPEADGPGPLGMGPARQRSVFRVPGMDCPAEAAQVRAALDGLARGLDFDLPGRQLVAFHDGPVEALIDALQALGMGAALAESGPAEGAPLPPPIDAELERRTLWQLLAINGLMFVVEALTGWWAESSGLLADGLDMLADAAVYGTALYAASRGTPAQLRAARLAGVLQLGLALGLFAQVGKQALHGAEPMALPMLAVSVVALAANAACLLLVARHRHGGAHMKASYIFSAADVLGNLGVIAAGGLVMLTGAAWPDWVVGSLIAAMVLAGSLRILRLRS